MLHTFVVYVENKPGVLSRVVSLFRRRAFNIDSLTVGRTEKPDVSRMTIVTDADEDQARRIETRSQILELATVFRAKVLDIAAESIIVELTGGEEKVDRLLELLSPFGLLEVVRTGIVAMRRGVSKSPAVASKSAGPVIVDDDTVSYSV